MPSSTLVAKDSSKRPAPSPDPPPVPEIVPDPEYDAKTSTWKVFQRTARILRKIQAHFDEHKQEDVMNLFNETFENFLLELQAADAKKKRPG